MSDCTECGWPVATDADNDRPCDDHCDHCRGLCWHEFTGVHRDDVRPDAAIATLTHRAEVAERSCEDAKRREQETSAKMQAMAQSESNKALRARAEAAERELAEVHRGVESVALHDARVARDAATARAWAAEQSLADRTAQMTREISDLRAALTEAAGTVGPASYVVQLRESAALWRERCNKAEQKVDDLRAKLARAEGVVAAARAVAREHDRYLSDEVGSMGHVDEACDALRAALATYEEG